MAKTRLYAIQILIFMFILVQGVQVNCAEAGSFYTCDRNGIIRADSKEFTQAEINISNIDSTGLYLYYGVDIGTFKLGADNTGTTVYMKRIDTNSNKIRISNFGDIKKYNNGNVYAIGYRVLYKIIGDDMNTIVESKWKTAGNSYFTPMQQFAANISHKQIISYNYLTSIKTVEVSSPDGSGLAGDELAAFNNFNFNIDEDYLKYKIRFTVPQNSLTNTNSIKVNLILNELSESGVILDLTAVKLDGVNYSFTKQSTNNYIVTIPSNSIVYNKEYCVEYEGRIIINDNKKEFCIMKNRVMFTAAKNDGSEIINVSGNNTNDTVDTKLFKSRAVYR